MTYPFDSSTPEVPAQPPSDSPAEPVRAFGPARAGAESHACIRVRGSRVHNLKNVSLDIPRDQLVVITGPSGSGKSSLAFDTIYAEGQRQYIESLSVYSRQFLHQMERPDVDLIDGLQPTLCIDQRRAATNPRSTVATVTEIYDYLRLMMARLGEISCYQCGQLIRQQTIEQIQDRLLMLPEGTRLMVMAPLVRGRRGQQQDVLTQIRKARFVRARIDGVVYDIDQVPELNARQVHHIEAVVDRIKIMPGCANRLAESLQLAVQHGAGLVIASYLTPEHDGNGAGPPANGGGGTWQEELFSTLYACPECGISFAEVEPRTFSFNSPYGACPECDGLGVKVAFDPELVVPDRSLSLADGAVLPWKGLNATALKKLQAELASHFKTRKFNWQTPLADLPPPTLDAWLSSDEQEFPGVLTMLEKEYATTTDSARREQLEFFRCELPCAVCGGSRLRPEARSVRCAGKTLSEITQLTISQSAEFFEQISFPESQRLISSPILAEICSRLAFLRHVGVGYLSLHRPADTLSGGELQRVRLATSIGSGLVGVCYVLDEPSIGLHQRDNARLIAALRNLQRQGNTVLVVEHDEAVMREADHLIDMGPAAGAQGGRVVAVGTPQAVTANPDSMTGRYLAGSEKIPVPATRRRWAKARSLALEGVTTNNLKNVSVRVPLGVLVAVTGVSGSGKSSLVNETLARALIRRLGGVTAKPGPHTSLRGVSQIDKVIEIDQSPIGRTPRSNAATYTGVFDEIRKAFANTRDAKQRGFRANRFSFNVHGGRCEACQGHGLQKIEMNFLPDLYVMCGECRGTRFNRQTLDVLYRGKSIADVLAMPVQESLAFFENFPQIHRLLSSLHDVGLGYLPLGQSSTTLSGGEAQRIKLATELARVDTGNTLYLLDEPTTGLHFDDIRRLLDVLDRLVQRGNTVLVIEHNLDVIKCADWIIDVGPDGGEGGGQIVATGTPEEIAAAADNHTGRFLRPLLSDGALAR